MLQLREKDMSDGELLRTARELRAVTRGTQTRLIINDRPDIEARNAIAELNGKEIGGRKAVVNEARPREERPRGGFGGNREGGNRW